MPQPDIEPFTLSRIRTRTYDVTTDPTALVLELLKLACPPGALIPVLSNEPPPGDGWAICDGRSLSKEAFPRLYALIGGEFGEDDTTFALPDLRGRMLVGIEGGGA